MLDLTRPELDFVSLARGMGVEAARAETAEELAGQLGRGLGLPLNGSVPPSRYATTWVRTASRSAIQRNVR